MFIACLPIRIMPLQLMVLQWKICETVFKVGLTTVFFILWLDYEDCLKELAHKTWTNDSSPFKTKFK